MNISPALTLCCKELLCVGEALLCVYRGDFEYGFCFVLVLLSSVSGGWFPLVQDGGES